ncbi:hypothetical protein N7541_011635 [Penicillium brevicompactum]|uniref:Uncharacterized protein n=1 Tax=Penicillium brevicompactum TaxID=5074 RepID=A0A9W9QQQ1_PENBR|nr:hypothetical protein N7541_011635 [Penicillium brevicompactum]
MDNSQEDVRPGTEADTDPILSSRHPSTSYAQAPVYEIVEQPYPSLNPSLNNTRGSAERVSSGILAQSPDFPSFARFEGFPELLDYEPFVSSPHTPDYTQEDIEAIDPFYLEKLLLPQTVGESATSLATLSSASPSQGCTHKDRAISTKDKTVSSNEEHCTDTVSTTHQTTPPGVHLSQDHCTCDQSPSSDVATRQASEKDSAVQPDVMEGYHGDVQRWYEENFTEEDYDLDPVDLSELGRRQESTEPSQLDQDSSSASGLSATTDADESMENEEAESFASNQSTASREDTLGNSEPDFTWTISSPTNPPRDAFGLPIGRDGRPTIPEPAPFGARRTARRARRALRALPGSDGVLDGEEELD